jgi:hypothetical protein
LRPSESDCLRAGISKAKLKHELNLQERDIPREVPDDHEGNSIDDVVFERLGRPLNAAQAIESDVAVLGAHIAHVERPLPLTAIVDALGWTLERAENALKALSQELVHLGLAVFLYADESVEMGPIATMLKDENRKFRSIDAARHAIALKGVSKQEAELLRNLMLEGIGFVNGDSATSHKTVRKLVKADLVRTRGDRIQIATEVRAIYSTGYSFGIGRPVE